MEIRPVVEFEGCFGPRWFFAKGHMPPAQFLEALSAETGATYTADDLRVTHSHARYYPIGPDFPGEMMIGFHYPPGRGAFPVTWVELGIGPNDPRHT